MGYRITTTRGNIYETDDDGAVVARSNGPDGWDYSGKWIILGTTTRHNAKRIARLDEIVDGTMPLGQGWVHDLDHGCHRVWGMERAKRIIRT